MRIEKDLCIIFLLPYKKWFGTLRRGVRGGKMRSDDMFETE